MRWHRKERKKERKKERRKEIKKNIVTDHDCYSYILFILFTVYHTKAYNLCSSTVPLNNPRISLIKKEINVADISEVGSVVTVL
jgi:hypothetical protein